MEWKGIKAGVNEMRRHYTNYLRGLPNIKDFRLQLVTVSEVEQIDDILLKIEKYYEGYVFEPRKINMESMAYSCDS